MGTRAAEDFFSTDFVAAAFFAGALVAAAFFPAGALVAAAFFTAGAFGVAASDAGGFGFAAFFTGAPGFPVLVAVLAVLAVVAAEARVLVVAVPAAAPLSARRGAAGGREAVRPVVVSSGIEPPVPAVDRPDICMRVTSAVASSPVPESAPVTASGRGAGTIARADRHLTA